MNRTKFALVSLFLLLLNVYPEVSRANDSLRDKVHKQILQIIEDGEYDNSQLSYDSNARNGLPSEPPFIIGGTPTDRNEFPEYTLVIFTDGRGNVTGLCGGTVIASNKVLTAAHCAQNRASTYFLIPGFYSFNDNITATDLKRVSRVIDHPRYSNQSFDFDIAVMTLSQSTSIRPASVIKGGNQLVGKVGEVIGTGLTATSPQPTVPDVLLSVEAPIISNRECSERYLSLTGSNPITSNMVCAGFRDSGKGSCSGDSGGPLYVKTGGGKAIAGVVSFGLRRCEAQRATSAYARTSAFTDFITQQSPNTRFVKPSAVPLAPIYSLLLDNGSSQPEVPGKDPFPEIDPFDQGGFVIKMASGFDDPIGDGHLFEYNPLNSNFEIRRFDPEQGNLEIKWTGWGAQRPVRSDVESWTLRLRMLGRLEVGEFNFNNGLDFSVDAGFFGSCGDRRGRLRIFEIETNAQNELTKLIADFTQKCPRNFGQLRGNINFVKENPPIEFPPRELSGTEPSPSLPELQYAGTIAKLQSQSSPLQDSSIETFDRTNSIISITNYNSRQTSVVIDVRSSDRLGWSLVLERGGLDADPEKGLPLSVGEYKFALNRKQVANTLSFARGSISCGDSIGSFRIYEIEHDLNGVPTKLLADFETDICGPSRTMLTGSIAFNSSLPAAPPLLPKPASGTPSPSQPDLQTAGASLSIEQTFKSGLPQGSQLNVFNSNMRLRSSAKSIRLDMYGEGSITAIEMAAGELLDIDRLTPGIYSNAVSRSNSEPLPWLRIQARSSLFFCEMDTSEFTIYEISYDGDKISRLTADFFQSCKFSKEAVRGSIYFDSTLPPPTYLPLPAPTGLPSPQLPPDGSNALILNSESGDHRLGRGVNNFYSGFFVRKRSRFSEGIQISVPEQGSSFNSEWTINISRAQLDIDPAPDRPIEVGVHDGAFSSSVTGGNAILGVSRSSSSCRSAGSFNIYEIEFDSAGEVAKLVMDFEHRCIRILPDNTPRLTSPLKGSVRYTKPDN